MKHKEHGDFHKEFGYQNLKLYHFIQVMNMNIEQQTIHMSVEYSQNIQNQHVFYNIDIQLYRITTFYSLVQGKGKKNTLMVVTLILEYY